MKRLSCCLIRNCVVTVILTVGTFHVSAQIDDSAPAEALVEKPVFTYPEKVSGDEAFSVGDYAVASSFYSRYRDRASKNNDTENLRDACERELDALIFAGLSDVAEKRLQDYETNLFPGINALSVSMWKADILLLRRKPEEAKVILERILPGFTSLDQRRMRALSSLAFAMELLKEHKEAAKNYSFIFNTSKDSMLAHNAFERMILNLVASGDLEQAKKDLLSFPLPENERDIEALRLLNMYILQKESGSQAIASMIGKSNIPENTRNDSFFYIITSLMADEFRAKGDLYFAVVAYRMAFESAQVRQDAFDALRRMSDVFDEDSSHGEAATLAAREYELFKGPYADTAMKMRIARLLANASRGKEALELYNVVMNDNSNPREVRIKALREALSIYVENKDFILASDLVSEFFGKVKSSGGEAEQMLAELLFKAGRFSDAADAYVKLAESVPALRRDALYQAALSHFKIKAYPETLKLTTEIMSTDANDAVGSDALYLRAMTYSELGDEDKALADYIAYADSPALEKNKAAVSLYEVARMYFLKRDFESAEKYFQRMVRNYADSELAPRAYYWLIYTYFANNKELSAVGETWFLLENHPDSEYTSMAFFKLASHYADSGADSKASEIFDMIIKRGQYPEIQAKAIYEKALLAYRQENYDEAKLLIRELEERFPDNSSLPESYYLLGDIHRVNSEYENAITAYNRAASLRPASLLESASLGAVGDVYFAIASQEDSMQKYQIALEAYDKLLEKKELVSSFRVMALYKRARCSQLMENDADAIKTYRELLYMLPPGEASSRPAERLWCVKAAENMVSIAVQRPLPANVEAALAGLKWLSNSGVQKSEVVAERMKSIRKLRFRP